MLTGIEFAGDDEFIIVAHTSDTSEVIVDVLVESGGVDLLGVEVLQVLLEDFICGLICFTKVLQDLKR